MNFQSVHELSQPPFFLTTMKAIQKVKFPLHGMKLSDVFLFPDQEEKRKIFSLSRISGEMLSQKHGNVLKRTV